MDTDAELVSHVVAPDLGTTVADAVQTTMLMQSKTEHTEVSSASSAQQEKYMVGCCSDKWKHPIAGMTQMWNDHSSGSAPWWKPRFNIVVNGNFSKIRLETGQHWNLVESSQKATLESVLEPFFSSCFLSCSSCASNSVVKFLSLSFKSQTVPSLDLVKAEFCSACSTDAG